MRPAGCTWVGWIKLESCHMSALWSQSDLVIQQGSGPNIMSMYREQWRKGSSWLSWRCIHSDFSFKLFLFPCSCLLHLGHSSDSCLAVLQNSYIHCHVFCSSISLILSLHSQTLLSSLSCLYFWAFICCFLSSLVSLSPCLLHGPTVCILIFSGIGKPNHPLPPLHTIFLFFSLSSPTSNNSKPALHLLPSLHRQN